MGSKRGRLLMRQHRVKKDTDPSLTTPEIEVPSPSHLLSVPHLRIERHSSEPAPGTSPPSPNLLSVPSSTYLTKQHSHPLLPSQSPPTLVMHRQMSHPLSNPQASSTPLHIQFIATSLKSEHDAGLRAMSPAVVIMGDQNSSMHETTSRIRNEELRRSASSPQNFSSRELEVIEGTRSSHCPVVRPGPALGCNFCWNTIDNHGRILRRKTKYHCPECQTNLCIVPCFQEYHEKQAQGHNEGNSQNEMSGKGSLSSNILKQYPKTGSF